MAAFSRICQLFGSDFRYTARMGSSDPRFLRLLGAGNVRDLGGLPLKRGGTTRSGRVLRSDFLLTLAPEDEAVLLERFGLRTVVDLRTAQEIERHPGPWAERGIDVVRATLPLDPAFLATGPEEMARLYLEFLESEAMATAVSTVIDPRRHPLLIHCAAGKDRTGVLVCLALDLIGVRRTAIVADYVLTHERVPAVIARLEAESVREPRSPLPAIMFGAEEDTIAAFLAGLDARHDGARGWALRRGIAAEEIAAFTAAMAADPS